MYTDVICLVLNFEAFKIVKGGVFVCDIFVTSN